MSAIGVTGRYDQIGASSDANPTWPVMAETDGAGNVTALTANGVEVSVGASGSFAALTGDPTDNANLEAALQNLQNEIDALVTGVTDGDKGGADVSGSGLVWAPKVGMRYAADTGSTADSDPGAGLLKWNNATQASSTYLYIDVNEIGGVDISDRIKLIGQGQIIRLEQESDPSRWQEWLVQGVVAAAGYYKLSVLLIKAGTAIEDAAAVRMTLGAIAGGYMGALSGDVTAVTYNADGSVATITVNGLAWTLGYNSNGSLATETIALAGDDLVRTYNYDADGRFTGVSGNVERCGAFVVTSAQAADLKTPLAAAGAAAAGFRIFVTDLGDGNELIWKTDHYAPVGGEIHIAADYDDVASTTNGTVNESAALKTFTLPGWLNSGRSWYRTEVGATFTGTTAAKTLRAKAAGNTIHSSVSAANALSTVMQSGRIRNEDATNDQIGPVFSGSTAGWASSSAAPYAGTIDTSGDVSITFTIQCANAADSGTLNYAALIWGAT